MKIEIYRRLTLRGKRYFFRMIARNGEIVAQGHTSGYHNLKDIHDTVGKIMSQVSFAKVEVLA